MRRVLLLSTVILLAGCGGEDPKAAYVADATAVCKEAVADFEALEVPTTPDGFGPYATALVGVIEGAQQDLQALTPPEDDRAALEDKVLDPLEELVSQGKDYAQRVEAAGSNQIKLLGLLNQRPKVDSIDVEYLRTYGLSTCADAVEKAG